MEQNVDNRGFDLKVEHLKNQIIAIINEYNLPISVSYYVINDVCQECLRTCQNAIDKQYEDFCRQANEEEQKENINTKENKE